MVKMVHARKMHLLVCKIAFIHVIFIEALRMKIVKFFVRPL